MMQKIAKYHTLVYHHAASFERINLTVASLKMGNKDIAFDE